MRSCADRNMSDTGIQAQKPVLWETGRQMLPSSVTHSPSAGRCKIEDCTIYCLLQDRCAHISGRIVIVRASPCNISPCNFEWHSHHCVPLYSFLRIDFFCMPFVIWHQRYTRETSNLLCSPFMYIDGGIDGGTQSAFILSSVESTQRIIHNSSLWPRCRCG